VLPGDARQAADVVALCYDRDVAITPRGGGSGVSGGAVPSDGIVLSLERLNRVRSFDPLLWRIEVEAGVTTGRLHALARENGLMFPPDPGAPEQSQVGGNIATNAGGPHAFRYGVTRRWVTGLEAVLAPGRLVRLGGAARKDVAGYDLIGLLTGSEGTLGIVTAAWLRLVPAPEARYVVAGVYADDRAACEAIERIMGSGIEAAAIELLDAAAVRFGGGGLPVELPPGALLLAEADGSAAEAAARRDELAEAMAAPSASVQLLPDVDGAWRWRDGLSSRLAAVEGGKLSEDVAVPLDRLADLVEAVPQIGRRHGLVGLSFGHAGDGNMHSSFLADPSDRARFAAAEAAREELLRLTVELGGTISAEHGLGSVKSGRLGDQWAAEAVAAHRAVKAALDPKNLFNPGKKV
jgi:glycolate oxidase subunit GlcD